MALDLQRYKFESNSQPMTASAVSLPRCVIPCKDTNLKAIHNVDPMMITQALGCVIPCKDTNLRAIHNTMPSTGSSPYDVLYLAKIQI